MSVSEPFIRRPIATSLLGIALMIGGALGYWAMPVSALPQVDFPTVQVTTRLPGASPEVVASLLTAPLERQLGQIPSLTTMTSWPACRAHAPATPTRHLCATGATGLRRERPHVAPAARHARARRQAAAVGHARRSLHSGSC